ncbi:HD domain-containing protein [Falsiroseomonas sp. E2-1-a20]|uniref:HD domain-containing protein n=1 Tax=Falsiroseomonas sp. E2-1-a20 TaxID=3239300 RepID=UPI003F3B2B6C
MPLLDAAVLTDLRRRYAEPHRIHHGWARIGGMLEVAEDVAGAIANRSAFILAVLFHNAVFEPKTPDSAQRSAQLMREMMRATPATTLARAEVLILAVARQELPETRDASLRGDAMLLLDSDLSILGAPPAAFDAYEAANRREQAHLRPDSYRAGRFAELQMLLWRERIFRTDRFFLACERQARRNIERALAQLDAE